MVFGKDQDTAGENNVKWNGGVSEHWFRKLMAEAQIPAICIDCGAVDRLHIHHKNKNHRDNRIENLEFVCPKCHKKRHPQKQGEEQRRKISEALKKARAEGRHTTPQSFYENGKATRYKPGENGGHGFKKGAQVWWQKAGYKSAKEAIIAKRGYWMEKDAPVSK